MYGGSKLKAKKSHFFPGNTSLVYVHDLSSIAIDRSTFGRLCHKFWNHVTADLALCPCHAFQKPCPPQKLVVGFGLLLPPTSLSQRVLDSNPVVHPPHPTARLTPLQRRCFPIRTPGVVGERHPPLVAALLVNKHNFQTSATSGDVRRRWWKLAS